MGGHSYTSGSLTCLDPSKLSWVTGEGMVLASKQESMHNPGSLQSVDGGKAFCPKASSSG